MNTWLTLYNKIKEVDLDFEAVETFEASAKDYERLNREQMYEGRDSDGGKITPGYAASTIAYKKRKGQPTNRVTLKDTGEFYNRLSAVADNDKIFIHSDVDYANFVAERYTDKIFGLDKENTKSFSFGPYWSVLRSRIENLTGLTFNK